MLNLEVSTKRVAVCIIAYNEKQNIESLLTQVLFEDFISLKVYVYTDGSTDGTDKIVETVRKKHSSRLTHIRGKRRTGKQNAYNKLLKLVEKYTYTIFLDGDIHIEKDALSSLVSFLCENPQYKVVGSFLQPVSGTKNRIPMIYGKVKEHIFKNGDYKYFTGRAFVAVTKYLPEIPKGSRSDDFYLNLRFSRREIGVCRSSVVGYIMPYSLRGMFWYSYYIGSTMTDVRDNYKDLWKEQITRIPLWDYVIFGLTQRNFSDFWGRLGLVDRIIFVYTRIVTMLGFVTGYITSGRKLLWEPIEETKSRVAI